MAANNSGPSRSTLTNFLSRIPADGLKKIIMSVKRNITGPISDAPIERNIDDPTKLIPIVHIWKGRDETERWNRIFDRPGVIVNQVEQFLSNEAAQRPETQQSAAFGRSHSATPRSKSRSGSAASDRDVRTFAGRDRKRNKSAEYRRSLERDRGVDRDGKEKAVHCVTSEDGRQILIVEGDMGRRRKNARRRSSGRDSDREKETSLERERFKRSNRDRGYSRDRDEERYRRRSRTPLRPGEYRPSHSEFKRRSTSRDRDARDKYSRAHSRRSRSRSIDYSKPSTSRKPSRSPRRSVTPFRDRDKPKLPRYESPRTRRSKSPGYKDDKRRSRSPRYERERRRSRSPTVRSRGSPSRYERKRSRSPGCKSPHPPIITFSKSRSDRRRSSRSPGYNRGREYKKRRKSRSTSPRKRRSRSPLGQRAMDFAFYEGIPGSEYWIPGPIRPGFPALPRYYPPAFFPRMPGAPMMLQPRVPLIAPFPPPYRQRLPVYNSKYQARPPELSGSDRTVSTTAEGEVAVKPSSSQGGEEEVTIQEVPDSECKNVGRDVNNSGVETPESSNTND